MAALCFAVGCGATVPPPIAAAEGPAPVGNRGGPGDATASPPVTAPGTASAIPPARHPCAAVCCGPDRLGLIDPAEITLTFLGQAAERSAASDVMSRLGAAGIGPTCPPRGSSSWTPERGTAREVGSCPGGRVMVQGVESLLAVVVTRWVARPAEAYGVVTLSPPAGTPPDEWLAAMVALLASGGGADDPIDDTRPRAYPVYGNVYASIHDDGPSITFGYLSRGGLLR